MKTVKLGDVCDFKARANNELLPYVGMEDVESGTGRFLGSMTPRAVKSSTSYFDDTCVLYGKLRPYLNKVLVPDFKGHCSTEFLAIRPDLKKLDRKYLWHFLISPKTVDTLNGYTTGTRMPRADINILKNLEISLPSLEEQRRVVERLDAAFEKIDRAIELTEKNITETNLMKSSILTNAFNVSNSKTVKLGDVCLKITDGSHYSPKSESAGRFPYVTVRDIDRDIINFDRCKHISEEQYIDLKKNGCKPEKGDVLFSKDGTVGKVSLVAFDREFVVLSSLAIIRPDQTKILPEYLFHILKSSSFFEQAVGKKSGTAIRRIILRDLKNIEIHIHESLEEQRRVVGRLDAAFEMIDKTIELRNKKLVKLNDLKQSALTQSFSGSGVE